MAVFAQCLEGLAFLHQHSIMHCDIKLRNVAVVSRHPSNVFLIDLGGAMWNQKSDDYNAGTISSLAPELMAIKNETDDQPAPYEYYDNALDLWSCGIRAFILSLDACAVCRACPLGVRCGVHYIVSGSPATRIVDTLSLSAVGTSSSGMCIPPSRCSILLVQFIKRRTGEMHNLKAHICAM